jgi:gas vesicle protein
MSKFSWFIAGIGLGSLAGILFAPKVGDETRAQLLSQANEAKEKAAALSKQTVDSAGDYLQRGKETLGQYLEQGKTLANEHLSQASVVLSAVKEAYTNDAASKSLSETASGLEGSSPVTSA